MQTDWQERNKCIADPEAGFIEATRRIAICRETRGEALYLGDVKIDMIPPDISSLTWLRSLNIYGSPLADLNALAPLVHVEEFMAGSLNSASPSLDFLKGWQSLRALTLIATTPLDLAPLAACTQLSRLSISCHRHPVDLINLETMRDSKALHHLSLTNMRASDFLTVGKWTALSFVQLIDTNLDSLDGFEGLEALKHLDVRSSFVSDLSPLSQLPCLRELKVAKTALSDLTPVTHMKSLVELCAAWTQVTDVRALAGLGLQSIDLSGCPISDIGPLSECSNLRHVDLSDTKILSVRALRDLRQLRSLAIARTTVRNLGPLGAFPFLGFFDARESAIESITALATGNAVQAVNISGTQVDDLKPLRDAKDCRSLNLRGSRVKDLADIVDTGSHRSQDRGDAREFLDFRDTPASKLNDRLSELAFLAEESGEKCFFETKKYLKEREALASRNRRSSRLFGLFKPPR